MAKPPDLNTVKVIPPGHSRALTWEVWRDMPLSVALRGEETVIQWQHGIFADRPFRMEKPSDEKDARPLFATSFVIYSGVCDFTEYLQHGWHDAGVRYGTEEKFERGEGTPAQGSIVGYGVTGKARHNRNPEPWDQWHPSTSATHPLNWETIPGPVWDGIPAEM